MDTHTNTPPADAPVPLLEWDGPTYPDHKRSKRWYAIGGAIVIGGVAYGIVVGAWSLSVVLLLCGALYFLQRDHTPAQKHIAIFQQGVLFNGQFVTWSEFEGFWIISTPQYHELHLARTAKRKPQIILQLNGLQPPLIRGVLSPFVKEHADKQEGFLDMITRICKL